METNEKTMPVPDGWEFGRIDDGGNIVLKEKKKELPKAWEDCLREIDKVEVLNCTADIMKIDINGCKEIDHHNRSMLPRGIGNPMLALCQLLVCRNAWWKQLGWKPDWTSEDKKWSIQNVCYGVDIRFETYKTFTCISNLQRLQRVLRHIPHPNRGSKGITLTIKALKT